MDNKIRYGIVGLGRAGWNIHVKQLRDRADAQIVAVLDPLPERRQQAESELGCKTYDSLPKMLRQDDIEVVVVASPSVQHGPDAKKALRAGKHVVVEKPVAMNVAEIESMIRAAQEAGRRFFPHHNLRFSKETTHLKQVIQSGRLGRLFHIRMNALSYRRRNDWQTQLKYGGGMLNNFGSHYLDVILQLMGGKIVDVFSDLRHLVTAGDAEDHVKVLLRADNGVTADLEASYAVNVAQPLPKWIICGTHGTLTSDGKNSTIRWYDPNVAPPVEVSDAATAARKYAVEDPIPWQEEVVPAQGPSVGVFYDNVYAVLRRGEPQYVTPESVRDMIRVMGMVRKGTDFSGKPPKADKPAAQAHVTASAPTAASASA